LDASSPQQTFPVAEGAAGAAGDSEEGGDYYFPSQDERDCVRFPTRRVQTNLQSPRGLVYTGIGTESPFLQPKKISAAWKRFKPSLGVYLFQAAKISIVR
jgi:hypothetical protein